MSINSAVTKGLFGALFVFGVTTTTFAAPRTQTASLGAGAQAAPAQTMDQLRQQKLFYLLTREGKRTMLDEKAMALLGLNGRGSPMPVMQVSAVDGKTRADFNRLESQRDEYVFFFDDDRNNPNSSSMAFRAGANFRLISAIEFSNGRWIKMAPARAAELYAEQMRIWTTVVDIN